MHIYNIYIYVYLYRVHKDVVCCSFIWFESTPIGTRVRLMHIDGFISIIPPIKSRRFGNLDIHNRCNTSRGKRTSAAISRLGLLQRWSEKDEIPTMSIHLPWTKLHLLIVTIRILKMLWLHSSSKNHPKNIKQKLLTLSFRQALPKE